VPNGTRHHRGAQLSSRILQKTGVKPLLVVGTSARHPRFPLDLAYHDVQHLLGRPLRAVGALLLRHRPALRPLATAATAQVNRAESGLASGVLNAARQVGGSVALAVLATAAAARAHTFADPTQPLALVERYRRAFQSRRSSRSSGSS